MSTSDNYINWCASPYTIRWDNLTTSGTVSCATNSTANFGIYFDDPVPTKDLQCADGWDEDENNF